MAIEAESKFEHWLQQRKVGALKGLKDKSIWTSIGSVQRNGLLWSLHVKHFKKHLDQFVLSHIKVYFLYQKHFHNADDTQL